MSLSQVDTTPKSLNPVSGYGRWKGSKGHWEIYSTASGATKICKELDIVVLDQLNSVTGFSRTKGIYSSNEVRDINSGILKVFLTENGKSTLFKEGLYSDIKAELKEKGIKFQKNVYAMANITHNDSTLNNGILKLDLTGASMSAWFEASPFDGQQVKMDKASYIEGAISYYIPVFETSKPDQDILDLATNKDVDLQEYLNSWNKDEESEEEIPF